MRLTVADVVRIAESMRTLEICECGHHLRRHPNYEGEYNRKARVIVGEVTLRCEECECEYFKGAEIMSKEAKSGAKSEAYGLPGDAVVKLREIAKELEDMGVLTRQWRKQAAYELEVIAELGGGPG